MSEWRKTEAPHWRPIPQIPKHGVLALPTDAVLVCRVDDKFYELVIPERPKSATAAQADFGPPIAREYME